MARKAHGKYSPVKDCESVHIASKWQMVNRKNRLYAIRYPLYARKGFTLVELLIVISIISLLLGFSLPAYNTYNTTQKLKQSSENMLQTIRRAQTNGISGVYAADCKTIYGPTYTYDGWYFHVHKNQDHVEHTSASCSQLNPSYFANDVGVRNNIKFLADNIKITDIRVLDGSGNPVAFDPVGEGIYVLFPPAGKEIRIYNNRNFLQANLMGTAQTVEITISDGSKTAQTRITAAGAINNF